MVDVAPLKMPAYSIVVCLGVIIGCCSASAGEMQRIEFKSLEKLFTPVADLTAKPRSVKPRSVKPLCTHDYIGCSKSSQCCTANAVCHKIDTPGGNVCDPQP